MYFLTFLGFFLILKCLSEFFCNCLIRNKQRDSNCTITAQSVGMSLGIHLHSNFVFSLAVFSLVFITCLLYAVNNRPGLKTTRTSVHYNWVTNENRNWNFRKHMLLLLHRSFDKIKRFYLIFLNGKRCFAKVICENAYNLLMFKTVLVGFIVLHFARIFLINNVS